MKVIFLIVTFLICHPCFSQRPHLELGLTSEFKNEIFLNPSFDLTAQQSQFHIYGLFPFIRISKLNWGGDFGIGFEKALNYFTRYNNKSTNSSSIPINRVSININPTYFIIKKSDKKWDVQIGLRNYFNLTSKIYVPNESELEVWKVSSRLTTNYTYKFIIFGIFYEKNIKSDYKFKTNDTTFGCRLGLII